MHTKSLGSKFLSLCTIVSLAIYPCSASCIGLLESTANANPTSEYIYKKEGQAVLMPVTLLGAVGKPGLYKIPPGTDIITLLGVAGGASSNADVSNIVIKDHKKNTVIEYDLMKDIKQNVAITPIVEPNNIIVIPAKEPLISNNTIIAITLISTILSIVTTTVVIGKTLR